jgi:hypothetical protein
MRRWLATLLVLILSGCSFDPPPEKKARTTASWSATAALIGQDWLRGAIPAHYAEDTIRTANKEIGKLQVSETARTATSQLLESVHSGDRSRAFEEVRILETEAKSIRARVGQ